MENLDQNDLVQISGGHEEVSWWKRALRSIGETLYEVEDYIGNDKTKTDYAKSQLFGPNGRTTI